MEMSKLLSEKQNRIALIAMTGLYPVDIGGPAPVAYFLADELSKRGMIFDVFIRADNKKYINIVESNEIKSLKSTNIIHLDIQYDLKHILYLFSTIKKILKFYKDFIDIVKKVDIVIYNSPPVDVAFLFPIIARLFKKKQIIFIHGGIFYESKNIAGRIWLKIIRGFFDKIIAVSKFSRKLALEFGFSINKIIIIPNGVPFDIIEKIEPIYLEGEPKILHVGRLAAIKNVETILRSFKIILDAFPKARLYLVGDGPQSAKIKNMAKDLHIYDKLCFVGYLPSSLDVFRYYKSCDIFVMASLKENFPISILEAMSTGIPVVLPDIQGGPNELIKNGDNGFLVDPVDYKQFAARIIEIVRNKNLKYSFISKNSEIVKNNYSWSIIGKRYFDIILLTIT